MLGSGASRGDTVAARLTSVAAHTTQIRATIVLNLLADFSALVLGVTLYGITREEDNELAVFALICRVSEGLSGAITLSSALLVVLLPLQFIGVVSGIVTSFLVMWMPALVFELSLAVWLLVKGATPARRATNL